MAPEIATDNLDTFLPEVAELIVAALNLEVAADEIEPDAPLFGEGLGLDSIDITVLEAPRGIIRDRDGKALMVNEPSFDLIVNLSQILKDRKSLDEQLGKIGKIVTLDSAAAKEQVLSADLEHQSEYILMKNLPLDQAIAVKNLNLTAFSIRNNFSRNRPSTRGSWLRPIPRGAACPAEPERTTPRHIGQTQRRHAEAPRRGPNSDLRRWYSSRAARNEAWTAVVGGSSCGMGGA